MLTLEGWGRPMAAPRSSPGGAVAEGLTCPQGEYQVVTAELGQDGQIVVALAYCGIGFQQQVRVEAEQSTHAAQLVCPKVPRLRSLIFVHRAWLHDRGDRESDTARSGRLQLDGGRRRGVRRPLWAGFDDTNASGEPDDFVLLIREGQPLSGLLSQ